MTQTQIDNEGILEKIRTYEASMVELDGKIDDNERGLYQVQIKRDEGYKAVHEAYFHQVMDPEDKFSNATFNRVVQERCYLDDIEIRKYKKIVSNLKRQRETSRDLMNNWKFAAKAQLGI